MKTSLTANRAVNSSAIPHSAPSVLLLFFLKQSNCVEVREIILIYTVVNIYAGDKSSLQPFISNFGKSELIVQEDSKVMCWSHLLVCAVGHYLLPQSKLS